MSIFIKNIAEHNEVMASLHHLDADVQRAGKLAAQTLRHGGKILFCGNGGSAADSQHLAAEPTGRFIKDRKPLAAVALSVDFPVKWTVQN
jgi:D-sedoheptulose 7-phosphate isomerase